MNNEFLVATGLNPRLSGMRVLCLTGYLPKPRPSKFLPKNWQESAELSCYSVILIFEQFIMGIPGTNTIPSMSISEYQGSSGANHCPMTAHGA